MGVLLQWVILVFLVVSAVIIARDAVNTRRDVLRVDRKLNLVLKQMGIIYEESFGLSERVRELARDPSRKIEAIKVYREETGAGLKDAKDAVEALIDSVQR